MIDKLVKRQNDNHSPGPVTWEIPSSYQGGELINTILCTFSRGNQRIGVGVPISNSGSLTSVPELSVWKAFYHVKSRSSTGILDLHLSRSMTKPTIWLVRQAKSQISLGFRPVWSESSLSAWRSLWSLVSLRMHNEDWSDWVDAHADLSIRYAHRSCCWFCHAAANWIPLCSSMSLQSFLFFFRDCTTLRKSTEAEGWLSECAL